MKTMYVVLVAACVMGAAGVAWTADTAEKAVDAAKAATVVEPATLPATPPKELSEQVKKGLKWVAEQQQKDSGGWAQGEESATMGSGMSAIKDKANVGDTCIAVLALLRSGSTPGQGEYKDNISKGIDFVCSAVEKSD